MESVASQVLAVEQLSVVRNRPDAAHSDTSEEAGGDGWNGDVLNHPVEDVSAERPS